MSRYHRHHHAKKRKVLVVKKVEEAKLVDRVTFVAAIVEPAITIPQVITIFAHHTAAGISLSTWIGYELLTIVWLWYGIVHKERMIMLSQWLFLVAQGGVILGGLFYGARW